MEFLTLAAGVPKQRYESVVQVDSETSIEEFNDRLCFLKSVYIGEFKRLHYVYNLVAPSVWEHYKLLDEHDLNEQVQLRQAQKNIRHVWKVKYGKKPKVAAVENSYLEHPEEEPV
jgi:hypothetical protein